MPTRLRSHAAAKDRLVADEALMLDGLPRTVAEARLVAHRRQARYRECLEDYFRGRLASHAVMRARVAWGQAESLWVELRQSHWTPKGTGSL